MLTRSNVEDGPTAFISAADASEMSIIFLQDFPSHSRNLDVRRGISNVTQLPAADHQMLLWNWHLLRGHVGYDTVLSPVTLCHYQQSPVRNMSATDATNTAEVDNPAQRSGGQGSILGKLLPTHAA